MKRLAPVIVAVALGLTACGGINSGTVVGKDYVPPREWVYMQPVYTTTCSGSPPVCTQHLVSFIPITMHDPECYRLKLDDGDDTGSVCVPREAYDRVRLGDHYEGGDS